MSLWKIFQTQDKTKDKLKQSEDQRNVDSEPEDNIVDKWEDSTFSEEENTSKESSDEHA